MLSVFKSILLVSFVKFTSSIDTLEYIDGPNVCWRNETFQVTVYVTKLAFYDEYHTFACQKFPPWCTEAFRRFKPVKEPQVLDKVRLVGFCCEGYALLRQNRCEPICSEYCRSQNDCLSPNNCARCESGYKPPFCKRVCESGYYGADCTQKCNCPIDGHYECNPEQGCICDRYYGGEHCEISLVSPIVREHVVEGHVSVVIPILLLCILASTILLLVVYYRRKVTSLENIITEIQEENDYSHGNPIVDNPSYSFDQARLVINNQKIRNLIQKIPNHDANLSKSIADSHSDCYSDCGTSYGKSISDKMKGYETESQNVNIYNSIEDVSQNHLYEKIQPQYKDAYDHLNHSRPDNASDPHYHITPKLDSK